MPAVESRAVLHTYRASDVNDYFWDDLDYKRHYAAEVLWEDGLAEGVEVEPHHPLGWIEYGEVSYCIAADSFGVVRKLVVPTGGTVKPGEPIIEIEERPPTMDEWNDLQHRAYRAEAESKKWKRIAQKPLRSLYFALTGSDRF